MRFEAPKEGLATSTLPGMEKLVYLMGDSEAGSIPKGRSDLRDALLEIGPALANAGALKSSFTVADLDDPLAESVYQANAYGLLDAKVSLWVDSLDGRKEIEAVLEPLVARLAGYLVTESVPRAYEGRDWADGERSPGVAFVSAFPKAEGIDDELFYARWHGSHTPLSLEIHPLLTYIRNAVARCLTPNAPPHRAIVNESVASLAIAADPNVFYSGEEGQKRATEDLVRFADYKTLSTVLMSEYTLKS
jgi:hypothetical protein